MDNNESDIIELDKVLGGEGATVLIYGPCPGCGEIHLEPTADYLQWLSNQYMISFN